MKLNIGKRIVMFFHWLFSLLICAALALYVLAPDFTRSVCSNLEKSIGGMGLRVLGIALLALYAGLAVWQLLTIVNRKKRVEKGFITVDSADTGKVRIAVSAIEQMARQSVRGIEGISEMKIAIDSEDDAIVIGVDASIVSGSHVPTITTNMQRSIRQFVEVNCGVAVRSVSVSINAVASQGDAGRRGFLGHGKARPRPAAANEHEVQPGPEPAAIPRETPPAEVEFPETVGDAPASDSPEASAVNGLDAPYESEFAKDLAAMRAREANGTPEDAAFQDERR